MKDLKTRNLLETLADIAYIAGTQKYFSGDSRTDIKEFIWWAQQFEELNRNTNWNSEDYMLEIEKFVNQKLQIELMI